MDSVFEQEQQHLTETHAKLTAIEHELSETLKRSLAAALEDKDAMLDEFAMNTDDDVLVETVAEYEAMNRIIDAYNISAEINTDRLHRAQLLLRQPYFAKVQLQFKAGSAPKDIYIGAAGMTDDVRRHFIVDWRSPVAEVYYNQANGPTSYVADKRTIECDLKLRRQFDIDGSELKAYFDTTVAIQDPLLLKSLSKQRSDKLQAITTTIQKEQNLVIRHEDVPVLLVNGIAGSGKTSVLLQRIAYLFYRERETLRPKDVFLITPNAVFSRYIDNVLPEMGETNPQTLTWDELMERIGLESRAIGDEHSVAALRRIDDILPAFTLDARDFVDIRIDDERVIASAQSRGAWEKLSRFPTGTHRSALAADDLLDRLEQRIKRLAKNEETLDRIADLSEEEQIRVFGHLVDATDEDELAELGRVYLQDRYAHIPERIENGEWLRIDRIGMRMLGKDALSSSEWLYLKLALAGGGNRDARYVIIDEVQDYTAAQLMVLTRYFPNAHFLLLGDENQAVRDGTATFAQIHDIFEGAFGEVAECSLMTSYRSSPEITELFTKLLPSAQRVQAQSVQRPGTEPRIVECSGRKEYTAQLKDIAREFAETGALTAIITPSAQRTKELAKQLDGLVIVAGKSATLPTEGVLLLDVKLAKGLEFDRVAVVDADDEGYAEDEIHRHRLYTAISRATQQVTLLARGKLTTLLQ